MSILLIHPPQVGLVGIQYLTFVEPLALERLAAALDGHDVEILDMRLVPDLEAAVKRLQPALVGITCPYTTELDETLRVAERVKQALPGACVIVGGHHPSLRPQDVMSAAVDAIAVGEGEWTFRQAAECVAEGGDLRGVPGLIVNHDGQQFRAPARAMAESLDELPLPARHLTEAWRGEYYWWTQRPHALVETSRGCPYRCTFCSVWRFYEQTVRCQSAERIADEVAAVCEPYIFFTDDNFLISVPRAQRAAQLIAERGIRKQYTFQSRTDTIARHPDLVRQWRDIGLISVFLGLESADTAGLDELEKRNTAENNEAAIAVLKQLGVGFTGNFIVDPQWGAAEFEQLRAYVRRLGLFNASFSVLTPLPGTTLYEEVADQITAHSHEQFDLWHTVLPTRLPLDQFYGEFASLWQTASDAVTPAQRRHRLLRGIWSLLCGRLRWSHVRGITRAAQALQDPSVYLRGHEQTR
jgi:radical SAM superfamily enzyme YgiQ (UPF0313 family)